MKKLIYTIVIAFSVTAFPAKSWADSPDKSAELERVELEIVKLKRELMDLERAYRFERNGADVKDVPEMTREYALTSLEISEELKRQERIKMQIVEKSVNTYLTEDKN